MFKYVQVLKYFNIFDQIWKLQSWINLNILIPNMCFQDMHWRIYVRPSSLFYIFVHIKGIIIGHKDSLHSINKCKQESIDDTFLTQQPGENILQQFLTSHQVILLKLVFPILFLQYLFDWTFLPMYSATTSSSLVSSTAYHSISTSVFIMCYCV